VRLAYTMSLARAVYLAALPAFELRRRSLRRARRTTGFEQRLEALRSLARSGVNPRAGTRTAELSPQLAEALAAQGTREEQVRLAEFDHDGTLLPLVDHLWEVPRISREKFLPRRKFRIWLVDHVGQVGVRKEFAEDRGGFLNELEALLALRRAGCAVPAVLHVDFDQLAITEEYIHGEVVREKLAAAGACIRDRDIGAANVSEQQRIERARAVLPQVLSAEQIEQIAAELRRIHFAGYVLEDVKYGNVIIEHRTGRARFVDFERALPIPSGAEDFSIYLRDIDRRKLNAHFGTGLVTAVNLGGEMPGAEADTPQAEWGSFTGIYAPVRVGAGLHWGPIWNTDVGIGRWDFIMAANLPIPQGGTVLDLGANNGFNALQMIKAGAATATAVEIDRMAIRQGMFLRDVYEWSDNQPYDLRYLQGSHGALDELNLPRFDLITAFCTLYYLDGEQMEASVRHIAGLTDSFVMQCNIDRLIDRSDEGTFQRASIPYTVDLMKRNGFTNVKVVAPPGYSRPLVIGRKPT
jgi:serine/threonine protein kinase